MSGAAHPYDNRLFQWSEAPNLNCNSKLWKWFQWDLNLTFSKIVVMKFRVCLKCAPVGFHQPNYIKMIAFLSWFNLFHCYNNVSMYNLCRRCFTAAEYKNSLILISKTAHKNNNRSVERSACRRKGLVQHQLSDLSNLKKVKLTCRRRQSYQRYFWRIKYYFLLIVYFATSYEKFRFKSSIRRCSTRNFFDFPVLLKGIHLRLNQ